MTDKLVRVKWAGANTPYLSIERLDHRIYPTKRELLDLHKELGEFIEYYKESFQEPQLDYQDNVDWDDMEPRWANKDSHGC